jgi:dienelactone hydrolase
MQRLRLSLACLLLPASFLGAVEALTPTRVATLRAQIRENFFIPAVLPPSAAETHRSFAAAPGVKAEALTYVTALGMRVPAILYLPDPLPAGKIPGVIVVAGHGGDKYSAYSHHAGIAFARAGAAVLTYDPPGEGERSSTRTSNAREHDALEGDAALARRVCGLMMTDIMAGVSCLAARPEIDPSRIGACGFSMGSFILALTGAVEPRLRACVLVGGGNLGGAGDYWDSSNKKMCQGYPSQSLRFLGDQAAVLYALHAARGPTFIMNGRIDQVITTQKNFEPFFDDLRARTIALHGANTGVFEYSFREAIGHQPLFLEKPAATWLARQLAFPRLDADAIGRLPETTLPGGLRAIGEGVPAYRREELDVFTAAEWEKRKGELTFAAWVKANGK